MTRRRGTPADSLELLLDTICNTFGGIIFIALLVVVLLMISGPPDAPHTSPQEVVKSVEEQFQLENLQRLKSRLQANLEKQMQVASTQTSNDFPENLATYQQELARHSELENAIPDLQKAIEQMQTADADLSKRLSELKIERASVERQAAALKQTLTERKPSQRKTLRMPVVRSPGIKSEILVVIQFNRLYFWHEFSPLGEREGLNADDFLVLSEEGQALVTTPNPTRGLPLDETPRTLQRIKRALNRFRPSESYLAVVVRPDSYGSFQYFREAAVASGFEYRLIPATADQRFVDRGGSGGTVQ